ncbi:glycosyl hydrolase-related protein [Alicyclobacillus fastidiosus]|uniref:Glycosyl hydrolase-related protein n=1 Tax=Alicyclobacillus fastidiosus TaxID=392011 RepID=A0ABY6ZGR6_9BACL|nr:glycoside hydrolase family 38 C-terminal domain-containing protein [Alicyclobacillus fastidiosus]WAH41309.1 glycosyl hydrolase-related protein [Alicyclobacillus fastidiosus]GMA62911.1 alpha-mannosidase [Alicyclobacillus fastidiosus]
MPYENININQLRHMCNRIQEKIYTKISALSVTAWVTPEPVSYDNRMSGNKRVLTPGDKWGERWDCAWFHFEGAVPEEAVGQKIVLLIDVNGEVCLVDEEGTPFQGLTNVNSEFDLSLGLPGKRVVHISENARGDEVIDLWGDAGNNDLFGHYRSGRIKEADIAICHEEMRQLYYDVEVLLELAEHLPEQAVRRKRILQKLYEVSLFGKITNENVNKARRWLAPELQKQGGDPSLTVSAVGHAHIDLAWLWPIRETMRKGARTFSTALRMMERYPDYVFGASQPQLYQWIKERHPKLYRQVKQRVKEGRWEVQGAMWVEPDSNLAGGEALVRQILYGKRFFQQEFDIDVKVLWLPDVFGYTASLPQILKKSGVDYMMTQKLSWNKYNDHPHHSFWWEGIDGSKVLSHMPPEDTYNSPAAPRSILKAEREYLDGNVSEHCLMLFGIGDGGGGPGEEHLERLSRERNLQGLSPVVQEPAIDFFDKLSSCAEHFQTWRGELYLELHQGTLTSQARNKRYNRKMEKALRELEFAAVLSSLHGGYTYPAEELEAIWKEVLLYQFHDILPGSSIKRVYDESLAQYKVLLGRVTELTNACYRSLLKPAAGNGIGSSVVLFNSLPWTRNEWVYIKDQWMRATVPSMGYQVISRDKAEVDALPNVSQLHAEQDCLENDLLCVRFDADGSISSIFDKECQREVVAAGQNANLLSVYQDSANAWDFPTDYRQMDSMRLTLQEVRAYTEGPQAIVQQTYRTGESELIQKIVLTLDSRQIDFITHVDWRESEKMLRTAFPVDIHTDHVNCEIQFGHLKRPTHRNTMWDFAKDEICAHQWIDLSQSDYGVALLNDCKYGHRAHENTLDINLLRSTSYPGEQADQAVHEFTYSLFPHAGDFVQAQVYRAGYELNVPLHIVEDAEMEIGTSHSDSFISLDSTSVMIESIKKAEDNDDLIIRLYETAGSKVEVTVSVSLPYEKAFIADLMEQPITLIRDGKPGMQLSFTPFEIQTVRLVR